MFGSALALLSIGDLVRAQGTLPSAVGSQANTDAAAQRRLKETMEESQRQRRIEKQIQHLLPALHSEKLSGPDGPVLTRKALAALVALRQEGILPEEALARASRSAPLDSASFAKTSAYLRNLFVQNSAAITPALLAKLQAGEDPAPSFTIPPYQP